MFIADSSTFLLLSGQETLDAAPLSDASGYEYQGITITGTGSNPTSKQTGPNSSLISRNIDGLSNKVFAQLALTSAFANYQASCTVECVINPYNYANAATTRTVFMHGQGIDEYFWLIFDQTGQIKVLFNIAGATTTKASGLTMTENAWHYVAARKTVTSGSGTSRLSTWDIWVLPLSGSWNATPGYTSTGVANPNPTGGAAPYNSVGCRWFGSANSPASFYFAGLRSSSVARTASELQKSFNRFKNGPDGITPDTTKPVVANVSPATGTGLLKTSAVTFDVTDETGLRRVLLVADFPAVGLRPAIREVIHDGSTWGPNYQGALNVRSSITGGYRFTILRDGGWPATPSVTPFAVDTSGNEDL